jgi:SAM-dependent methyltransferase
MEFNLPKTKKEILALIGPVSVAEQLEYLKFHAARYKYLLEIVAKFITIIPLSRRVSERVGVDSSSHILSDAQTSGDNTLNSNLSSNKILDIGTGFEVDLLRHIFKVPIDTAGFYHSGWPVLDGERFYELDLNNTELLDNAVDQKYPLIIMAEVIEHLYTAPEIVLDKIKTWLEPNGILVIQTPNAVSLPKRLKMLLGIQPFEKIRLNKSNPGHFREYTMQELTKILKDLSFEVLYASRKNYFSPNNKFLQFLFSLEFLWPPSLRTGMTVVVKGK